MHRAMNLFAAIVVVGWVGTAWPQERPASQKLPDGVYAVLRESPKEDALLPLKQGETLVADRHRYQPKADKEAPRFLIVHNKPEVTLDLAGEPKAVKQGSDQLRLLLKLRPEPAAALEQLTQQQLGGHVAIILGGEVVTVHKIRAVIKGGDVQITSCTPGAAEYLLKQLQARTKS